MTQEDLKFALELNNKIEQCATALRSTTNGVFQKYVKSTYTYLVLPEEVCLEIRDVIDKWKKEYEMQLQEL